MQTLSTEEIGKSYRGRRVVNGVSLTVHQGEVVGLLGPNGAGKTTSFYMIVGLIPPDSGRVMIGNTEITDVPMYLRARQHGISYLPQEASVFRKLSVEENILAVLETQNSNWEERHAKMEGLLDQLGLAHIRKNKGYALSGGERRRVEIARALCISPSFILLDEPFSGIDPIAVLDLQKIIFSPEGQRHRRAHHRPQRPRDALGGGPRLHHQRRPHLPHRNAGAARQRSRSQARVPGRELHAGVGAGAWGVAFAMGFNPLPAAIYSILLTHYIQWL